MKSNSVNEPKIDFHVDIDDIDLCGAPEDLKAFRKRAWKAFQKIPFPNTSMREWKKSKINQFKLDKLTLMNYQNSMDCLLPDNIKELIDTGDWAGWFYLSPSVVKYMLHEEWSRQGVELMDLKTAIQVKSKNTPLVFDNHILSTNHDKFYLFTEAFAQSGVVFFVPDGVDINKPILIVIDGFGENQIHALHHTIKVGKQSSATVIIQQDYNEKKEIENVSSIIEEITIGSEARFNLVEIELAHPSWWIFNHKSAQIQFNGKFNWLLYAEGGLYSRSHLEVQLIGDSSEVKVTGICIANNSDQLDWQTSQKHLASQTLSDLLFCNALANQAYINWSGMIHIFPKIIGADGYQANHNLLLCDHPKVDSKPGLEILSDDVRCSHGVTIGEIDKNQIFYLQSRGISENEAKHLITQGFLESKITRIPDSFLQKFVREKIYSKIGQLFCEL
jgi:Fe-S cluster assembly protein SufD